jgi:hypothetical protein
MCTWKWQRYIDLRTILFVGCFKLKKDTSTNDTNAAQDFFDRFELQQIKSFTSHEPRRPLLYYFLNLSVKKTSGNVLAGIFLSI